MYQPPGTPPPFGGTPPPFAPVPPPPSRKPSGPTLALLGCGGLALIAVLVLVVIGVASGGKKTVVLPPRSSPSTASNTFGGTYVGTWKGTVIQTKPVTGRYTVTVVIPDNSDTGQITYENDPSDSSNWSCSGTLKFLHLTPGADYKSVVQENITSKNNAKCDTYSYNVLFPKPGNTGALSDGMFIKNYFTVDAADADNDHNAIGELQRQS